MTVKIRTTFVLSILNFKAIIQTRIRNNFT